MPKAEQLRRRAMAGARTLSDRSSPAELEEAIAAATMAREHHRRQLETQRAAGRDTSVAEVLMYAAETRLAVFNDLLADRLGTAAREPE